MIPDRYTIRMAAMTDADIETLAQHRYLMFSEMGGFDADNLVKQRDNFAVWARRKMQDNEFFTWFVMDGETIVGGTGIWVIDWPPGPDIVEGGRACIYNVYTEPEHRRQGLAEHLMRIILKWCQERGIHSIMLHASDAGRPLYEKLGFTARNEMRIELD